MVLHIFSPLVADGAVLRKGAMLRHGGVAGNLHDAGLLLTRLNDAIDSVVSTISLGRNSSSFPWDEASVEKGGEFWNPLECGKSMRVDARSDKWARCPPECPLFAEHFGNDVHCDFRCVEASSAACMATNPNEPIVDIERGICRACLQEGCSKCSTDGTDTCAVCSSGYVLRNGQCENRYFYVLAAIFGVIAVLAGVVLAWVVDLARRPTVNQETLDYALLQRSRAKLHMPKDDEYSRELWPLSTNLTKEVVAGPQFRLAFNFQVTIIVWAFAIGIAWVVLAYVYDLELLQLGLHRAKNARQNCIVVAFGYETQRKLMYVKTCFLIGVYVFSFVYYVSIAVRHQRLFQDMDDEELTYKDFTARVLNLPLVKGSQPVEKDIKEAVERATGEEVVGVSVCWDFKEHAAELFEALDADLEMREKQAIDETTTSMSETSNLSNGEETEQRDSQCLVFQMVEDRIFGSDTQKIIKSSRHHHHARERRDRRRALIAGELTSSSDDLSSSSDSSDTKAPSIQTRLEELWSTRQAFVVFRSEYGRDEAVRKVQEQGGFEHCGRTVKMIKATHEPASVKWENVADVSVATTMRRFIGGICTIALAFIVWVVVFYAPYAYHVMSFNYAHGQEPGIETSLMFTIVVVLGNTMMYTSCGLVADRLSFMYNDDREVCYMLLYSCACVSNVMLDMVVTYKTAYSMMVGMDMKTYNGVRLAEVSHFTERFQTYAMQRSLGQNLLAYAFPSTFLIPFCIEPLTSVYAPLKIFSLLIRSHKNIGKHDAEKLLLPQVINLSRYADLLLNTMLAALMLFFPGGLTHRAFLALAFSHCVIYVVDHYKVLRCIRACFFASNKVDRYALDMLSIPCALIAVCATFKANCQEGNAFHMCTEGYSLVGVCSGVFFGHIILHLFVCRKIVPLLAPRKADDGVTTPYEEIAKHNACSWFSCNPVHCLRSKYVLQHEPPCDFWFAGKEHLLRANPGIGCYFQEDAIDGETYDEAAAMASIATGNFEDVFSSKQSSRSLKSPSSASRRKRSTSPSGGPRKQSHASSGSLADPFAKR